MLCNPVVLCCYANIIIIIVIFLLVLLLTLVLFLFFLCADVWNVDLKEEQEV